MSSSARVRGGTDAKRASAVADRLRATENALKEAQTMIAEQEKREKELKRLLVTNGRSFDDARPSSSSPPGRMEASMAESQMQAMKTVHDNKVRALMKSIHQLQEQLHTLKSQDKEHRRSALIQNLRKSQREQELLIDVLKQTLAEKVPEFQESRELVNDFILKKAIGGPLRFRPPPREELENELEVLDGKYKRAVENMKKAKGGALRDGSRSQNARIRRQQSDEGDEDTDESASATGSSRQTPKVIEKDVFVVDPAQQEEIDQLKVEVASKNLAIHSQADEMHELYAEIDRLRICEERVDRKKEKIEQLEEKLQKLQLENVKLVHEKESEVEKSSQLRDELQFLRDSRIGDQTTSDSERLRQLELVQSLRAREMELQNQMEEQQKKWSIDRTNINQQMRLLEKERDLAKEEYRRCENDLQAVQKKHDRLFAEGGNVKAQLSEYVGQRDTLATRIQELEGTIALHESLSRDEHEAQTKSLAARLREMEQSLSEKDELAKKLDRQLTASKLLARQSKKEKEQLQDRCATLQEELSSMRKATS